MIENWKIIRGYPDYHVSDLGHVKSVVKGPKLLTPYKDSTGGLHVRLYAFGKSKTLSVSKLVATAFIPNPDRLPEVGHFNGFKSDNRVENLKWIAPVKATVVGKKGQNHGFSKLTDESVRQIRNEYKSKSTTMSALSKKHNVHLATISSIISGRTWSHLPE